MARNVEIKARVSDAQAFKARAEQLADEATQLIHQVDTFFDVAKGRLKLRMLGPGQGQLIFYERPDAEGPKLSNYCLVDVRDPEALQAVLGAALGVRGSVAKTRHLFLAGQTRIHLDCVAELGWFMELEVVLRQGQGESEGRDIAEALIRKLAINRENLVESSYIDLLEHRLP